LALPKIIFANNPISRNIFYSAIVSDHVTKFHGDDCKTHTVLYDFPSADYRHKTSVNTNPTHALWLPRTQAWTVNQYSIYSDICREPVQFSSQKTTN